MHASIPSATGRISRYLGALTLAPALAVAAQSKPAEAGDNWIGPAIAGVIIGAAIAHNQGYRPYNYPYRYGYKYRNYPKYSRYHYRYPRYRYRPGARVYLGFPHVSVRIGSHW